jgi:hypothetical protein
MQFRSNAVRALFRADKSVDEALLPIAVVAESTK